MDACGSERQGPGMRKQEVFEWKASPLLGIVKNLYNCRAWKNQVTVAPCTDVNNVESGSAFIVFLQEGIWVKD
ncbi:MAG: hypothetical protein JXB48_14950 [Candidatus Latescibacteria bacterium]|nr:hypothetical protein [Candidatus Latescibacterota bacterium]